MKEDGRPDTYSARVRHLFQFTEGRVVSVFITTAAITLAVLHLARPQLNIDAVTVALVAIAFLPWLAPIIKSVTLPGGFAIELRDVKNQLDQVTARVSRVERFVFSGPIGEADQNRLSKVLEAFSGYLQGLRLPVLTPIPNIQIADDFPGSMFNPNTKEILLNKFLVKDAVFLLHEYARYVLFACLRYRTSRHTTRLALDQIEAGLALYFPCSFLGSPVVGGEDAAKWFGVATPYVASLENSLRLEDIPSHDEVGGSLVAGQVWGAILWALRSQLSKDTADELIANSWILIARARPGPDAAGIFVNNLATAVSAAAGNEPAGTLRAAAVRRGLTREL